MGKLEVLHAFTSCTKLLIKGSPSTQLVKWRLNMSHTSWCFVCIQALTTPEQVCSEETS